MQKPEEQKQGAHERALIKLGNSQMALADLHRPAMAEVIKNAQRDNTDLLRNRGNSDAAQATANNNDVLERAAKGDATGLAADSSNIEDIRNTALRDATQIAKTSRDASVDGANQMLAGQAGATGQGLAQVARLEASDLAQKAQIRQQQRADRMEALSTVASATVNYGVDKYNAGLASKQKQQAGWRSTLPDDLAKQRANSYGYVSPYARNG